MLPAVVSPSLALSVGEDGPVGELTARQVESLTAPGRYTDGDGLMLVIDSAGRKYWHLRCTLAGKRRDLSLGPVRGMSLREAREAALKARVEIRKGIDPVAQRKAATVSGITFAAAALAVHAGQKAASAPSAQSIRMEESA